MFFSHEGKGRFTQGVKAVLKPNPCCPLVEFLEINPKAFTQEVKTESKKIIIMFRRQDLTRPQIPELGPPRMEGQFVGTRKHQKIRIDGFWCLIRVFPGDLSIIQGLYEV